MQDSEEAVPEFAPLPEYSEDGVDLSLIRWMFSPAPLERLEFLEDRIADMLSSTALLSRLMMWMLFIRRRKRTSSVFWTFRRSLMLFVEYSRNGG